MTETTSRAAKPRRTHRPNPFELHIGRLFVVVACAAHPQPRFRIKANRIGTPAALIGWAIWGFHQHWYLSIGRHR